jgi:hypothetical protein
MTEVIFDPVFVKEKKILLRRTSEERVLLGPVRTAWIESNILLQLASAPFASRMRHLFPKQVRASTVRSELDSTNYFFLTCVRIRARRPTVSGPRLTPA